MQQIATKMIAFLQDNLFMGFVESAGAEEIIRSARKAGYNVVDYGSYFNVELVSDNINDNNN